jgi:hypothetical protein
VKYRGSGPEAGGGGVSLTIAVVAAMPRRLRAMGDDAIAALRARHATDRAASGLPPIEKPGQSKRRTEARSPSKSHLSPGKERNEDSVESLEVTTPRNDAHEALLAELQRAPGTLGGQQISSVLNSQTYAIQKACYDQGKAAIRETIGLRAATSHRRLAGHREAKRDPARAYSGLGGLATRHRSSLKRSPQRRLNALPRSPGPGEVVPLAKGDEVRVKQQGEAWMYGVVQAIWQSRRKTLVIDGAVVPALHLREVLVRFDVGAQWVSEDDLELLRHPSAQELRSSVKDLDPDLTTTLGRSLWAQINGGPDGKGIGEDGAYMPAPNEPIDKLLISELIAGRSPPRKKQDVQLARRRAREGESTLTPVERQMFQAVMREGSLSQQCLASSNQPARNHKPALQSHCMSCLRAYR